MERIDAGEVRLAAHVWPGGEPSIVGIHGLTANYTCWYPVADALAARYRFIAYDLRGRGESDKPAHDYNLAAHGRDLLGLLDHFKISRAVLMGHSLGAHIAVRFAAHHPDRVAKLVLYDGGIDVRAEILDSLGPSIGRLGVDFPSLEMFMGTMESLPFFTGRWNEHLARYFHYDVEPVANGRVRSKAAKHAVEEEVAALQRTRLWVWHHRIQAPTLLLRAPDGLLRDDDCLMTQDEAEAMAHAIPDCQLVVVPKTNHYTVLLGDNPGALDAVRAHLAR